MKQENLNSELMLRREFKFQIREKINYFCFNTYGISDFYSLVDKHFPERSKTQICLARQVPTPNIEHLSLLLSAKNLENIEAEFLSLNRDSVSVKLNAYKRSIINPTYIFRGRNGNIVTQGKRITNGNMQRVIFSEIETIDGRKITDVHWELIQKSIFTSFQVPNKIDAGNFFLDLIRCASKNLPEKVFIKAGKYEELVNMSLEIKSRDIRPPADWYYFFYLCLFLDGNRILASTIDEDPDVIAWFANNNQTMKGICGFPPLILDTPLKVQVEGVQSKLNEIPKKALDSSGFLKSIPELKGEKISFFEIMKYYQESLIANS